MNFAKIFLKVQQKPLRELLVKVVLKNKCKKSFDGKAKEICLKSSKKASRKTTQRILPPTTLKENLHRIYAHRPDRWRLEKVRKWITQSFELMNG